MFFKLNEETLDTFMNFQPICAQISGGKIFRKKFKSLKITAQNNRLQISGRSFGVIRAYYVALNREKRALAYLKEKKRLLTVNKDVQNDDGP